MLEQLRHPPVGKDEYMYNIYICILCYVYVCVLSLCTYSGDYDLCIPLYDVCVCEYVCNSVCDVCTHAWHNI